MKYFNKSKSSSLHEIVEKHKNSLNKQKISNKIVEKHINSSYEIENVIPGMTEVEYFWAEC